MDVFIQRVNSLSSEQLLVESNSLKMQFFNFFNYHALNAGGATRFKRRKAKMVKRAKGSKGTKILKKGGTTSSSSNSISHISQSSFDSNSLGISHNIYDVIEQLAISGDDQHYDALPEFYRYFLKNPDKYNDIFGVINKLKFEEDDTFDDLNIITLMCVVTFHIGKFYLSINVHTNQGVLDTNEYEAAKTKAAEAYHLPFQQWLDFIIGTYDKELEYKQNYSQAYHNPYQYLLLMSYISSKLPFEHMPLIKYLRAVDRRYKDAIYDPNIFNLTDDVLDFLGDNIDDDSAYEDEFLSNTRKQVIYENPNSIQDVQTNNKIELDIINIFSLQDGSKTVFFNFNISEIFSRITDPNKKRQENDKMRKEIDDCVMKTLAVHNIKFFVYVQNATNTIILIDRDPNNPENQILYNVKFEKVYEILVDTIKYSANLEIDLKYILQFQLPMITRNILLSLYKEKRIWYYLLQNQHIENNHKYIKNLLLSFINNNFDKTVSPLFTLHWNAHAKNMGITNVMDFDFYHDNVLIYLLKKVFPNNVNRSGFTPTMATPRSVFRDYGLTYNSVHSESPEPSSLPVRSDVKIMLHNLLKLTANHMPLFYTRNDLRRYYKKIYKYRDSLLLYSIDLDTYNFNTIKTTPESLSDKSIINRSFVKEGEIPQLYKDHKDLFYGFMEEPLMKTLIKIYTRTVEGAVKDITKSFFEKDPTEGTNLDKEAHKELAKNGMLRISKIQRYITKFYLNTQKNHQIMTMMNVTAGAEADLLFQHWTAARKPTLNRPYNISYRTSQGTIDAGGPTKQFFTNISKQIQDKYFRVLDEETSRCVFKEGITANEAEYIGQLMAVFIKFNIPLPFAVSKLYIAHLMFRKEDISKEHLFLYYLLDVNKDTQKRILDMCKASLTKRKEMSMVDEDYCNPENVYTDFIVPVYKYDTAIMSAFSKGFFINNNIFYSRFYNINDKIRLYDMDKILSQAKLTKYALQKHIFSKISIKYGAVYENRTVITTQDPRAQVYQHLKELMTEAKKADFDVYYENFVKILEEDALKEKSKEFKDNKKFKEAVLLFWSGIANISFVQSYKIIVHPNARYPGAATCSTELILPEKSDKQTLYNDFMTLFITGHQGTFENI